MILPLEYAALPSAMPRFDAPDAYNALYMSGVRSAFGSARCEYASAALRERGVMLRVAVSRTCRGVRRIA